MVFMAACSSAVRKLSNTRCSRTAITPKQSSSSPAKSSSTWATHRAVRSPPLSAGGLSRGALQTSRPPPRRARGISSHFVSNREQVVDTMIELTRLSNLQRAILAGSDRMEMYLALRRRGLISRRPARETSRMAKGEHAVGLITGPEFPSGHRGRACPDIAVPQRQRGRCRADRLP